MPRYIYYNTYLHKMQMRKNKTPGSQA